MQPRGDGPFQIIERINDNAYKVDLPGEYNVSATFNVSDLSLFDVGSDSRTNPFEEGGDDMIQESSPTKASGRRDPLIIDGGPMTRSRTKQVKQAMGLLVQETIDGTMFEAQNGATFMFGSKVESTWINLLSSDEIGG